MDEPAGGRKLRMVAIGLAVAALVTALAAVIVVAHRGGGAAPAVAAESPKPPREQHVAAEDVLRLQWPSGTIADGAGVRVRDPALAKKLGLEPDDVIVSISGRPVVGADDLHAVIFNTSMMKATMLYVELGHDRGLVRWKLDGDLRKAAFAALAPYPSPSAAFTPNPDPLLDTIVRVDDTHVTIPRASVDAVVARLPSSGRIVPGQPDGVKLFAIMPLYERLGFANGDTVTALNGNPIASPAQLRAVQKKLEGVTQVAVEITRRGQPLTLVITVN